MKSRLDGPLPGSSSDCWASRIADSISYKRELTVQVGSKIVVSPVMSSEVEYCCDRASGLMLWELGL